MTDDVMRTAVFELLDHGFSLSVDHWDADDYALDRCKDGDFTLRVLSDGYDARLLARSGDVIKGWLHFIDGKVVDVTEALREYIPETLALIETREELERGTWG